MESTNLVGLIKSIENKEILLPDFQRGFVWNDEMQKRLAASVLTKMPIGNILLLEADAQEYGCKMIGRKTVVDTSNLENVHILLDGQQRMTVLTNIFSNVIFDGINKLGKELLSAGLKRRFFIKIKKDDANDIWGLHKLCFDIKNPDLGYPKFLSNDTYNSIEMLGFNANDKTPYNPTKLDEQKLISFCCYGDDAYYIPLFLLYDQKEGRSYLLYSILKTIASREIYNRMIKANTYNDNRTFLSENFGEEYLNNKQIAECIDNLDKLEIKLIEQSEYIWSGRILHYLEHCIEKMDLNEIIVKRSERDRAIDIYENINLGGVTLSTFELVMAKASKEKIGDGYKNLFDCIRDYIEENKKYPSELVPERMESAYKEYRDRCNGEYSASSNMKCYIEEKNQLNKKYTDAFLDVLCLYCNNKDYNPDNIKLEYIKRQQILQLTSKKICGNYLDVCKGLDRACFFLQMRCGIRSINEVNYNLMLVLLGYLFIKDEFWKNKSLAKKMEGWYWSSIFSGVLDKDQNTRIMGHIKNIIQQEYGFIESMKNKMFKENDFSDKATVLMETSYPPKTIIKSALCQYYLSLNYKDLRTEEILSTLCEDADNLEEHHILPLGNDEDMYRNQSFTSKLRKDKNCIYNSPVNYIYITKKSNQEISAKPISLYKQICNESSLHKLRINQMNVDLTNDENVKEQLGNRYDEVTVQIRDYVEQQIK